MNPISFLEKRLESMRLDSYEIFLMECRQLSVHSKEGAIDFASEATERGVALRLFREGRCGFGCSSVWEAPFLERMVSLSYNALSCVEKSTPFELPGPVGGGRIERRPSGRGCGGAFEEKAAMALRLEKAARSFDRRVTRVRDSSYAEEAVTVTVKNSRGLERTYRKERHEISLMVAAEEGDFKEMAWENEQAVSLSAIDPESLGRRVAEKAVSQLGARPVATQRTPAVLDPMVAASFLGVLSSSFLGDQVAKNRSTLRGRLGETIYSRRATVVDDGRRPGGYASAPFDGEGTTTSRNEVVSEGVLKRFLYDSCYGAREEGASTGNAVRSSFKEPPHVGVTNFFIEPGEEETSVLLAEMGDGFWIRDVIGIHTADAVTGDFSLGASGLWMEGGKRKAPVRGVTISGNLHDLFKNVVKVGQGIRFYHSYGAPPLLIDVVDVGGT